MVYRRGCQINEYDGTVNGRANYLPQGDVTMNKNDESTSKNAQGCEWSYDSKNSQMVTACKEAWPCLHDEMKFCFNCGKSIKLKD